MKVKFEKQLQKNCISRKIFNLETEPWCFIDFVALLPLFPLLFCYFSISATYLSLSCYLAISLLLFSGYHAILLSRYFVTLLSCYLCHLVCFVFGHFLACMFVVICKTTMAFGITLDFILETFAPVAWATCLAVAPSESLRTGNFCFSVCFSYKSTGSLREVSGVKQRFWAHIEMSASEQGLQHSLNGAHIVQRHSICQFPEKKLARFVPGRIFSFGACFPFKFKFKF